MILCRRRSNDVHVTQPPFPNWLGAVPGGCYLSLGEISQYFLPHCFLSGSITHKHKWKKPHFWPGVGYICVGHAVIQSQSHSAERIHGMDGQVICTGEYCAQNSRGQWALTCLCLATVTSYGCHCTACYKGMLKCVCARTHVCVCACLSNKLLWHTMTRHSSGELR